jgi:carboxymethylenebutenolidase
VSRLSVRPAKAKGPLPASAGLHENRGLKPHIEDIARRLALEDFIAFAPTPCFRSAATRATRTRPRASSRKLDQPRPKEDFVAAAGVLEKVEGRQRSLAWSVSATGGRHGELLATRLPDLRAAVPFYGAAAPLDQVAAIKAELLIVCSPKRTSASTPWAGLRAKTQGTQGPLRGGHVSRHAARLQQTDHAALRRGGREAGVGTHARVLQSTVAGTDLVLPP